MAASLPSILRKSDETDTTFTFHGELGVSFAASSNFDVIVAYRFEHFDTDIDDAKDDFLAHLIRIGLRFF